MHVSFFNFLIFFSKYILTLKIKLFTFGDSHSHWNYDILSKWKQNIDLISYPLYGKTLHGATQQGLKLINFNQFNVDNFSIVMFNYGEVDSRNHIHKFRNVGIYNEVRRLVLEYEKLIKKNSEMVPGAKIWIGGLVPPKEHPLCEHIGSPSERFLYNRLLDEQISRMAKRNNFFFIDNYEDYADEFGFLNSNISDGHIHVRQYSKTIKEIIANEISRFIRDLSHD
jgi:hypothetical protein